MAVYYSFHYERDNWRVQQVMKMGQLEGQPLLNSQSWEAVRRRGDKAIEQWIDEQMKYKSAVVVLVGAETDTRTWVRFEIAKAWDERRPLVGVRIHGMADWRGGTDRVGGNPFLKVGLQGGGTVADYVPLYEPRGITSSDTYALIKANLKTWVASAYKRT